MPMYFVIPNLLEPADVCDSMEEALSRKSIYVDAIIAVEIEAAEHRMKSDGLPGSVSADLPAE